MDSVAKNFGFPENGMFTRLITMSVSIQRFKDETLTNLAMVGSLVAVQRSHGAALAGINAPCCSASLEDR